MKKYFAVVALMLLAPMKAMALGSLEYGLWNQTAGGNVTIPPAAPAVFSDTTTSQGIISAELDLPIPLIPNLKVTQSAISLSNGADTVNADTIEALIYWQPLDNVVTFRYGAGVLIAPMEVTAGGNTGTLPGIGLMYYAAVAINPNDKLSIGYQMTGPVVAELGVQSSDIYVSYKVFGALGVKAGMRTQSFSVSDGTNSVSMDASGTYISAILKF